MYEDDFVDLVTEVSPETESEFVTNTSLHASWGILPTPLPQRSRHASYLLGIFFAHSTITFPGMASTAVHFLFDAIASLVALDESDGLLNFRAAFRSFEPQAEVKNAPILLTFVVCARVLQVLVSTYALLKTHTTHAESI
jgi:hypothetical protein